MNKIYFRLAKSNVWNNKTLYLPYLFSGIISVMMFYLMMFLYNNEGLAAIPHTVTLRAILQVGDRIIAIFAVIFLFYTNSFIIKRRKKEIGIYYTLGMEKKHIAGVLSFETISLALGSILLGLLSGIVFSKLLLMSLYKMLKLSETISFEITWGSVSKTLLLFAIIYGITLVYNLLQIAFSKPIDLLHGSNAGEKEPKTKILMTIIGLLCLGGGYYISITTENPIQVISLFFVAVLLVIVGTYFLFIAGSIDILKGLRKNKKYYYDKRHFTAVSGMLYRMKQNAAGLASICILSTMVLVMLSTTVSMYIGVDDIIDNWCGNDCIVDAQYKNIEDMETDDIPSTLHAAFAKEGIEIKKEELYHCFSMIMKKTGNTLVGENNRSISDKTAIVYLFTRENLIASDDLLTEENVPKVEKGKVLIYSKTAWKQSDLQFMDHTYMVQQMDEKDKNTKKYINGMMEDAYAIVLEDEDTLKSLYREQREKYPDADNQYELTFGFDMKGSAEKKNDFINRIRKEYLNADDNHYETLDVNSRQSGEQDFYSIYGGLFFLGVFLGSMFLVMTVLIIFYKQITEGYDDKERYLIMEKVGMSSKEVKKSIHSQILIVFFLPITVAVIHVIAAFPLIRRMLYLLNLTNTTLFVKCFIMTIIAFALIYFAVYMLTSKAYYKIVGDQVK